MLEEAVAAALVVNKQLNQEVDLCVQSADQAQREKAVWEQQAKRLGTLLASARGGVSDQQLLEQMAQQDAGDAGPLRGLTARDDVASTSGAFQPSDVQLRGLSTLIARGRAAGWLLDPKEVRACEKLPCTRRCAPFASIPRPRRSWLSVRARSPMHSSPPAAPQIVLGEVLGQGAFGTTFKAQWRGAEVSRPFLAWGHVAGR